MPDMDPSSKTPQISDMFQKFALAFKTKTFEFFADDDDPSAAISTGDTDCFSLLDSAEEIITDQKVVVIKPDQDLNQLALTEELVVATPPASAPVRYSRKPNLAFRRPSAQMTETLISSIFAIVSSIEVSYLQLQSAHIPFAEDGIQAADKAMVSHVQRLSDLKRLYRDYCRNPDFSDDLPLTSRLEAQVQENQSKLRGLETVVNLLQLEIDQKDSEVMALKKSLGEVQMSNLKLSNRLSRNLNPSREVVLTVGVFDSMLHDVCKSTYRFTKLLISLMRKAGWDLGLVVNSVYPDVEFAKEGHSKFAFLSYVCLGMFRDFDLEGFGSVQEEKCNGHGTNLAKPCSYLKQLLEHVANNPMEILSRYQTCEFSKFCEKKYQELIHPTMESSIFSDLDQNKAILDSWRSLSVFYESFVNLASSIWILHKLAHSFDPKVEIFQVERGLDYSMVYMADVTRRCISSGNNKPKVAFTVVPGFKFGKTVIQSQVYLRSSKPID